MINMFRRLTAKEWGMIALVHGLPLSSSLDGFKGS